MIKKSPCGCGPRCGNEMPARKSSMQVYREAKLEKQDRIIELLERLLETGEDKKDA